ncbi:MAG: hypothetical protein LC808_31050, partial [Actinobacteria bacterium]|nr:hypothetical protein [Actinomycetota bacterium]
LKESLFASTYSVPQPVTVQLTEFVRLAVVVTAARAVYDAYPASGEAIGCYEFPDYEFEGWVMRSGFGPPGCILRVLIRLIRGGGGNVEGVSLRVVKES